MVKHTNSKKPWERGIFSSLMGSIIGKFILPFEPHIEAWKKNIAIYDVLESIDTKYNIDNRLIKLLAKNRQYRPYIGDITDFLRKFSKEKKKI